MISTGPRRSELNGCESRRGAVYFFALPNQTLLRVTTTTRGGGFSGRGMRSRAESNFGVSLTGLDVELVLCCWSRD